MSIARTQATGGAGMLPSLVSWSSSFASDLAFVREDLLGSAAHVTMLARTGLVPVEDAAKLRGELLRMFEAAEQGTLSLPGGEEDVHMAVEAELTRRLGAAVAGRLHTARSRNDQVALDLRLFVRNDAHLFLSEGVAFAQALLARARTEVTTLMPAYTHRQRAQPVTAAFLLAAWAADWARALELARFAMDRADESPLGSGACSGTSLPIDRDLVRRLLGFSRMTVSALDAVGDRGFIADWTWAASRALLSLGKMAGDLVDFSTSEFALVRLDGQIAAGSSMMPQKKNPDMFELIRGKGAHAVAQVAGVLALIKGLPSGYNRDQQEDRRYALESGALVRGAVQTFAACLPHVHFDGARGEAMLREGFTQATDLAESLVQKGLPFREAYQATGALVRRAIEKGVALSALSPAEAQAVHAAFDEASLASLDPARAVSRKEVPGGTGPRAVAESLDALGHRIAAISLPTNNTRAMMASRIAQEPLEPT